MAFALAQRAAAGTQAAKAAGTRCGLRSCKPVFAPAPLLQQQQRWVRCRAEEEQSKAPAPTGEAKEKRDQKDLYVGATNFSLQYLDGSLPGDFGFDPLGLLDPANSGGVITPEWLTYSEVIHCRWAMLGAAGCITPEILAAIGVAPAEAAGTPWYASGVIQPAGTYQNYWTDPYSLFYVEIIAMQFAELRRLQDFRKPGSMGKQYFLGLEKAFQGSGNPSYPGGPFFNLFNLGKNEKQMRELKLKEIKNGRLAMLAMFGYGAQATLTKVSPLQNLLDHLRDPVHANILTNFGKSFTGV